nr:hypothetical protein CFP56_74411 [Quercus suber]
MKLVIADIRDNQEWNWENLSFVLPPLIKDKIRAIPCQDFGDEKDVILWKHTKDGEFTVNSTYLQIIGSSGEGEIDKALARFDKGSGMTLGVTLEGKNEGNKEECTVRRAESTQKAVESKAEKLVDKKGATQSREQEGNLCGCMAVDEFQAIWDYVNVREGWMPPFAEVRRKC